MTIWPKISWWFVKIIELSFQENKIRQLYFVITMVAFHSPNMAWKLLENNYNLSALAIKTNLLLKDIYRFAIIRTKQIWFSYQDNTKQKREITRKTENKINLKPMLNNIYENQNKNYKIWMVAFADTTQKRNRRFAKW